MPTATVPSEARARRNLRVLVAAQVILGSQMPVTFILGGLAGQMLAPNACLATLPISVIILGSMLSAPLLADLMQRRGRRIGFALGAAGGGVGSAALGGRADPGLLRRVPRRIAALGPLHVGAGLLSLRRHRRRERGLSPAGDLRW